MFTFLDLIVQVARKKVDENGSRLSQLYLPQFYLPLTMSLKSFLFNWSSGVESLVNPSHVFMAQEQQSPFSRLIPFYSHKMCTVSCASIFS